MTNQQQKPASSRHNAATAAATALAIMLASNACPSHAFQASSFLAVPVQHSPLSHHHYVAGIPSTPPFLALRCGSPWDADCFGVGGMQPFRQRGGFMRRGGPMIFSPPGIGFLDTASNLQVRQPEVADTEKDYTLAFEVPSDVDEENGLDVSVSGRLLTVTLKRTIEESSENGRGPRGRRRGGVIGGGWVSRSSHTDTVARSFVLPEGVSTSGVTASRNAGTGKLEVKFNKLASIGDPIVKTTDVETATNDKSGGDKTSGSSASANYLSSLSPPAASSDEKDETQAGLAITDSPAQSSVTVRDTERAPKTRPMSVFEALDKDFGEFAKLMWGDDNVFASPTAEEMAARVEAARDARAKRVMARRRASMATEVFEKDGSYVVRVALPEGATREDVKLTVTPDNTIRVSFSPDAGARSAFKDVRLPRNALLSEISAKFQAEPESEQGEGERAVIGAGISGLEITVGKVVPPAPTVIDIM